MRAAIAIAAKDLRLLLRNRGALFFTLAWPLLLAVFFGLVFGGGGGSGRPAVALVVADTHPASEQFAAQVLALDSLAVERMDAATAERQVRQGKRSAAIVLPAGFGQRSAGGFSGDPPEVLLWLDPSRRAERAMIEGMLLKLGGEAMFQRMSDPAQRKDWLDTARADLEGVSPASRPAFSDFYDSLDTMLATPEAAATGTDGTSAAGFTPLRVVARDVAVAGEGPRNGFAISFTQGMFWALLGALMSFVTALVLERSEGTWDRLRCAPVTAGMLLLGKAMACFTVMLAALLLVAGAGALAFAVVPQSPALLLVAFVAAAVAFTGLMMLLASLGASVQSATGLAWAVLLPMAMAGGAMIPLFVMPPWMLQLSHLSLVKWAVLAFEGAIWRGFSLAEMLPALAILLLTGLACGALGAWRMRHRP